VVVNGTLSFTLTILLATRDGEFVPAPGNQLSVGEVGSVALAVADFNGDGILDIASLGQLALTIFVGDGQGGFSPTPFSPIDIYALGLFGSDAIGVGDFNGDGNPDLVIVDLDTAGDVLVLLGDGKGNFSPAPGSPTHTGQAAKGVAVADFNMDGHLDVAITYGTANQVGILLGDGMGRLSPDPKGPFPTGDYPLAIVPGDFNGDGKPDLAVVNWSQGTMSVLLGDGTGGFVPGPDTNIAPDYISVESLAVGDMDGDGILDLVLPGGNKSAGLAVLLGDGKGGFEVSASGPLPGMPLALTLADFNGDGRLDVATVDYSEGTVSVYLGAQSAESSLTLTASENPTTSVPVALSVVAHTSGFRAPTGTVTIRDGSNVVATGNLVDGAARFRAQFTAGEHTLVAVYLGDARTTGSASPPLTINVTDVPRRRRR
jgi:FG-GAP-like repeat/Bacterial Ig-like domain (group 3)